MQRPIISLCAMAFAILCCWACTGGTTRDRTIQVSDGDILILGSGTTVALVKLTAQKQTPETVDYECLWQDGVGVPSEIDQSAKRKSGKGERDLRFGPFAIGWSVEGNGGKGWLYLDRFPGEAAQPAGMKVHLTKHRAFKDVSPEDVAKVTSGP